MRHDKSSGQSQLSKVRVQQYLVAHKWPLKLEEVLHSFTSLHVCGDNQASNMIQLHTITNQHDVTIGVKYTNGLASMHWMALSAT